VTSGAGARGSVVAAMALVVACADCGGGASVKPSGPDAGARDTGVDAGVDAGVEPRCEALCQRLAKLQCPAPSSTYCMEDCTLRQSFAPWCDAAGKAVADCLTKQPDSSFACGGSGAEANRGVCEKQQAVFQDCLFEGPLPDMTQDCAAYSSIFTSLVSSLGCGKPLSKDDCLLALSDRIPCNGALAIYFHCNAHEPASSFQCTEAGPAPKPDARCAPYAFPLVLCTQPNDSDEGTVQ